MGPPIIGRTVNPWRLRSLLLHSSFPFFVVVSAFAVSGASFYYPLILVCTKSRVFNITDASVLERRDFPGFVWQSPDAPELRLMKAKLANAFPADASGMEKATAIRKWCRDQQIGSWGGTDDSSEECRPVRA
jgi:hypothetical protein